MRRITAELSIAAVAAAIIACLILLAGTAIGSAALTIADSYVVRSPLCTASYCEPTEIVPASVMRSGPTGEQPVAPPDD